MEVKAGTRLASTVCSSEVIVIQSPEGDLDITCGGCVMFPIGDSIEGDFSLKAGHDEGILLGKRYVSEDEALELLSVKPGEGSLALNGEILSVKGSKPLPSSD